MPDANKNNNVLNEYVTQTQLSREWERKNAKKDDTGVECPEKEDFNLERLTYQANGKAALNSGNTMTEALERLKMYEDAHEQGLLHFAPCKDGALIWCVIDVGEENNSHYGLKSHDAARAFILESDYCNGYTEQCFGVLEKDWFLSEAAAVRAALYKGGGV